MNQRNARLERKQVQLGQWSRDAGLTWPGHRRPAALTRLDLDAVRTVPGRTQTDTAGHVCHLRWESWTSAKCLKIITVRRDAGDPRGAGTAARLPDWGWS